MNEDGQRRAFFALYGKGLAAGFAGSILATACGGGGTSQPAVAQTGNPPSSGGDTALGSIRDVVDDYGADPTGEDDSIANIQRAIDETADAGGGTVFFPSGRYSIGASILPRSGVSLVGVRPAPAYPQACADLGITLDGAGGSWLQPTEFGAGISGIEFNTASLGHSPDPLTQDVPVSNILIGSLGFVGFDYGIRGGAPNHRSFAFGRLEDLMFLGAANGVVHTRCALDLWNFQHTRIDHVKVWNCLHGINLQNSHSVCSGGNSVVIEPYVYMNNASTANSGTYGLRLATEGNGSAQLNAVTVIRPQVNWFFGTPPGLAKSGLLIEGIGAPVVQCELTGVDVEGALDAQILLRNAHNMLLGIAVTAQADSATECIQIEGGSGVVISQNPNAIVNTVDRPASRAWSLFGMCRSVRGFGVRGQYVEVIGPDAGLPVASSVVALGSTDGSSNVLIRSVDTDGVPRLEGRMLQVMPTLTATSGQAAADAIGCRVICAFDNQDVFLKLATDSRRDLEYLLIKSSTGTGGIRIRAAAGDTLSGSSRIDLVETWSFVRLYCAGQGVWVILEQHGTVRL